MKVGKTFGLLCTVVATFLFVSTTYGADYFEQPVASVVSSGGQKLIDVIGNVSQVSERPEIETFLQQRMDKLPIIKAFDLNQPIGAYLFFPREGLEPVPMVIVPVANFTAIRSAVEKKYHVKIEATDDPEYWVIPGKKKTFQLRYVNGFAIISQDRDLLLRVDETFIGLMKTRATQFDLSVIILPQEMPAALRDIALYKIKADINKNLKRKPKQSDEEFELAQQIGKLVLNGLTHVVQETTEIRAELNFQDTIHFRQEWKATTNSTLAKSFAELHRETNAFPVHPNSPASLITSITLPQPLREVLQRVVLQTRKKAGTEIGQDLTASARNPLGEVFDTLAATIEHGELNTLLEFQPIGDHFALITAMSLQQPNGLASSLRAVLPYVESDEKVKSVEFDLIDNKNLHVHRITGTQVKPEDREIYGDDIALYVGTDQNAGWFAMGNPNTSSLISARSTQEEVPAKHLAAFQFSLHPWIQHTARKKKHDEMLTFLQAAFPRDEDDNIHITLSQEADSLLLNGEIEPGYQKLAGIIVSELLKRRKKGMGE